MVVATLSTNTSAAVKSTSWLPYTHSAQSGKSYQPRGQSHPGPIENIYRKEIEQHPQPHPQIRQNLTFRLYEAV